MERNIVLIHPESTVRDLLELNLELYLGANIHIFSDLVSAQETIIKKAEKFDLFICSALIEEEKVALEVYKLLKKFDKTMPLLVMGYEQLLEKKVPIIKEFNDWKAVIKASAKILGITAESAAAILVPEYYPINIALFKSLDVSPSDIYLKITTGDSAESFQYVKRFKEAEEIEHELIDKYLNNGIEKLYVPSDKRLRFAGFYSASLAQKLKDEALKGEERMAVESSAYYHLHENIKSMGLTNESMALAETTIGSMASTVETSPGLFDLLNTLKKNPDSFLYNHSLLIAFVGNHVLRHLLMGTKEQQNNFCFIAFFHDITLEDDKLAKIHNEKELEEAELTAIEKDKIHNHALMACSLLREHPQVPMVAPLTIKQHHCTLDGKGFIDFPGSRLNPMAQVFRVVEDYVVAIMKSDGSEVARMQVVNKLKQKYTRNTYKDAVAVLLKLP